MIDGKRLLYCMNTNIFLVCSTFCNFSLLSIQPTITYTIGTKLAPSGHFYNFDSCTLLIIICCWSEISLQFQSTAPTMYWQIFFQGILGWFPILLFMYHKTSIVAEGRFCMATETYTIVLTCSRAIVSFSFFPKSSLRRKSPICPLFPNPPGSPQYRVLTFHECWKHLFIAVITYFYSR